MNTRILALAFVAGFGLMQTGCGAYHVYGSRGSSSGNRNFSGGSNDGSGIVYEDGTQNSSAASGSGSGSGTTTTVTSSNLPTFQTHIYGVGYDYVFKTVVQARKVLKVKFTADPTTLGHVDTATGQTTKFLPSYSFMGVYIGTPAYEVPTAPLYNGLTQAQESQTIDLSHNFDATACPATDATCRVNVEIRVEKPNTDEYCFTGKYCPPYYRAWNWVGPGDTWEGDLEIQTDDTVPLSQ